MYGTEWLTITTHATRLLLVYKQLCLYVCQWWANDNCKVILYRHFSRRVQNWPRTRCSISSSVLRHIAAITRKRGARRRVAPDSVWTQVCTSALKQQFRVQHKNKHHIPSSNEPMRQNLGPCAMSPLNGKQLVHGQVTIIFVVSVCLFVCLFMQFFSAFFDPISIKLWHVLYVWV